MSHRFPTLVAALAVLAAPVLAGGADPDWKSGPLELRSAGALATGPGGVLFVADPQGAAIVALKLGGETATLEAGAKTGAAKLEVEHLDEILAFQLGTGRESIAINDLAYDPAGVAYVSITRGKGKDEQAALARIRGAEEVEILALDDVPHVVVPLENAPEADGDGPRSKRTQSITDLVFEDGRLYVAGLSNEEFASKLRVLDFPFADAGKGTSIQIYHASHGALETRAPVRAMVPIDLGGKPNLLCGYTCTPLVKVPVEAIEAGSKFVGTTVAELGNRNTPLDMVVYEKDGQGYLLIANTSRGVMKLATAGLATAEGLTEPVSGPEGVAYETITALSNVTQLAPFDGSHALALIETDAGANLATIALP